MNNYGKVFKVFLRLKWNEIERWFYDLWWSMKPLWVVVPVAIVGFAASIFVALLVFFALGHLYVWITSAPIGNNPEDYMNYGTLMFFSLIGLSAVGYGLIRFGIWIRKNWRTAKLIVERDEIK